MSLDFAIKDFYRKKKSNYPYLLTIALVIGMAEFLIYFSLSLGINLIAGYNFSNQEDIDNEYYFSGGINLIYSQFNTLIIVMVIVLAFIVVVVITTTLIIHKKRDIAIMKALGTLPEKLYSFYLLEAYILFILGFLLGFFLGLISFGIFALIMEILGFKLLFRIDYIYTPALFFSCFLGIFIVTGYSLRKIGKQKITKSFSQDIPYSFDATQKFTLIPRWLSSLGFNLKIAIMNTNRRKNEYLRFFIIFSLIFLIIFTLGLGTFVLNSSSQEWIRKSQGEDIVVIGHEEVIDEYADMYRMFSDPTISVDDDDINFIDPEYMFNKTDIAEVENIDKVEEMEARLIKFCDIEELIGYYYYTGEEGGGGYRTIGQERDGNYPIIGVNPDDIIQDFEIEGRWFDEDDDHDNMTIGDGLAYNFFDYPFDQSMKIKDIGHRFHISGVIIDSFYSGYAGYIDLHEFQEGLNFTHNEVNLILLELKKDAYDDIKDELKDLIEARLGAGFTCKNLDDIFEENINYLSNLTLYPILLIILMAIISILSLYNYQKAGLVEKAKDFLIMRALGTKRKSVKRILFLEALFIIIPSLLLSLALGMLINSVILFDRVYLPPLYIPLIGIAILFGFMIIFNLLSLIPIMKKIDRFSIKDFDIY
ncbi:MAG: FtsX-like permease family protein [Promethearchaeota archaeon]|nr:MAG: FtsX-like permease family protein [Candidatus Lokiarchaeota archaeon]